MLMCCITASDKGRSRPAQLGWSLRSSSRAFRSVAAHTVVADAPDWLFTKASFRINSFSCSGLRTVSEFKATTNGKVAGLVIPPDDSEPSATMGMAFIPDEASNARFGLTRKPEAGVKPATGVNPLNPVDPNSSGLIEVEKGPRPNGVINGVMPPVIGNVGKVNPGGKIEPIPGGNNEFIPVTADAPGFIEKSRADCSKS